MRSAAWQDPDIPRQTGAGALHTAGRSPESATRQSCGLNEIHIFWIFGRCMFCRTFQSLQAGWRPKAPSIPIASEWGSRPLAARSGRGCNFKSDAASLPPLAHPPQLAVCGALIRRAAVPAGMLRCVGLNMHLPCTVGGCRNDLRQAGWAMLIHSTRVTAGYPTNIKC
jgi:hypothetical protein